MGKEWVCSQEQDMFLKEKIPDFSEAQKNKRVTRFFGNVYEEWFKRYPERDILFGVNKNLDALTQDENEKLAEAIFNRKEQLHNYFYWHAPSRQARNNGQANFSWLVELLTGKRAKGAPRQKKLLDVYSNMFYKEKIRPKLDQQLMAEFGTDRKSSEYHSRRFTLLPQLKKECWEQESEEVRQLVQAERMRLSEVFKEGNGGKKASTQSDLEAIRALEAETKNLPAVLDQIAQAVLERTGFATTILLGGIRCDGTLGSAVLQRGKTAEGGLSFKDTMMEFEEAVLDPWGCFLERAFPLSKRQAQRDLYKKVYRVNGGDSQFTTGRVRTEVWGSEDDENEGGEDEEDIPDKETPSTSGLPNEEVGCEKEHHSTFPAEHTPPLANDLPKSPILTPPIISTSPSMTGQVTNAQTPSNLESIPNSDIRVAPTDIVPNPNLRSSVEDNNTSGSGFHFPNENLWDQPSGFTSMSEEFNFAMASLDTDISMPRANCDSASNHDNLLRQNSIPYGGLHGTFSDVGIGHQSWPWLNPFTAPTNNFSDTFAVESSLSTGMLSGTFAPGNAAAFQVGPSQNAPFNLTSALLSGSNDRNQPRYSPSFSDLNANHVSNQPNCPPLCTPPDNTRASGNTNTTNMSNEPDCAALVVPAIRRSHLTPSPPSPPSVDIEQEPSGGDSSLVKITGRPPLSETVGSAPLSGSPSSTDVEREPSGGTSSTVESTGQPQLAETVGSAALSSTNKKPSESASNKDVSKLPLQEIPSNITRRQSGRAHKPKRHRDAEFAEEQEAREMKRKKGGIQARKQISTT